ncbi:hypothetical protein M9458_003251, partial [Cirrhinus mrigala]
YLRWCVNLPRSLYRSPNRLAVTDWLRTSWTQFTGVTAHPCTYPSRTPRLRSTREEGITTHRSPKTPTALSPV